MRQIWFMMALKPKQWHVDKLLIKLESHFISTLLSTQKIKHT
jgi:hypothetical protein